MEIRHSGWGTWLPVSPEPPGGLRHKIGAGSWEEWSRGSQVRVAGGPSRLSLWSGCIVVVSIFHSWGSPNTSPQRRGFWKGPRVCGHTGPNGNCNPESGSPHRPSPLPGAWKVGWGRTSGSEPLAGSPAAVGGSRGPPRPAGRAPVLLACSFRQEVRLS